MGYTFQITEVQPSDQKFLDAMNSFSEITVPSDELMKRQTYIARKGAMYVGYISINAETPESQPVYTVMPRYTDSEVITLLFEKAGIERPQDAIMASI